MSASSTLAGRHALVTGASRGIGASIARSLIAAGARVSLIGRHEPSLLAMEQQFGAAQALAAVADVTDPAAVRSAFAAARARFGPVHILINNAGQAASAKFTDTDEALWTRLMEVNLGGAYRCTREALPDMLSLNFGRIVNVASIAGLRGAAYISAYSASKHGMIGLTRSLAIELAAKGITVNAVCPGYTDTELVREAIDRIIKVTGRSESEVRASLVATNPQRRLIEPDEVAHTVVWLCTPGSESITGQSIVIAGGEIS